MKRSALQLCVLTLLAAPALAESAQPYFEKLAKLYERSFSVDMVMDMSMDQGGQGLSMSARGTALYGDQKHMRMTMTMDMAMPGAGAANGMQLKMLMVSDGEDMWMEMETPMAQGKQVMKMPLAEMEKMAGGFGGLGQMGGMDPLAQIRALQKMMTFEVVERSGGAVVLKGTPTEEMKAQMGPAMAMMGGDGSIRMAVSESTGVPQWMSMGPAEKPFLKMRVENYKVVTAPPASTFSYTPPPGTPVINPLAAQTPQ